MAFFNPHSETLDAKLTSSFLLNFVNDIFSDDTVVFYDYGFYHTDISVITENERREIYSYISLRTVNDSEKIKYYPTQLEFSLGEVKEFSFFGEKYLQIPFFKLQFSRNIVNSAALVNNSLLRIELSDLDSVFEEFQFQNESIVEKDVFEIDGKYYKLNESYMLLSIEEEGVAVDMENFDVFVFEEDVASGEYIPVLLGEESVDFQGVSKVRYFSKNWIEVLVDSLIPEEVFCGFASRDNMKNSVVFENKGIVNVNSSGHICKNKKGEFPKVYINRKEGILGGEC